MDYEGQYSDCCGAPIVLHDLCSECKEHCEPWVLSDTEEEQ